MERSIETATFYILTPYPGTKLYNRLNQEKRITSSDWNKYDTRHAVYIPKGMTQEELKNGYKTAYQYFYSWSSIFSSVSKKEEPMFALRHLLYTSGWKKFEYLWKFIIRRQKVYNMIPLLEKVLSGKSMIKNDNAIQYKADVLSNFTASPYLE